MIASSSMPLEDNSNYKFFTSRNHTSSPQLHCLTLNALLLIHPACLQRVYSISIAKQASKQDKDTSFIRSYPPQMMASRTRATSCMAIDPIIPLAPLHSLCQM